MSQNLVGNMPSLTIGGRVFTDLDNLKTLYGFTNTAANISGSTFREFDGTAGYQVPVGKKFVLLAMQCMSVTTTGTVGTVGYCDNDIGLGSNPASATNPVYCGGSNIIRPFGLSGASITTETAYPIYFEVPAEKYLFIDDTNATAYGYYKFYGYEVDA